MLVELSPVMGFIFIYSAVGRLNAEYHHSVRHCWILILTSAELQSERYAAGAISLWHFSRIQSLIKSHCNSAYVNVSSYTHAFLFGNVHISNKRSNIRFCLTFRQSIVYILMGHGTWCYIYIFMSNQWKFGKISASCLANWNEPLTSKWVKSLR